MAAEICFACNKKAYPAERTDITVQGKQRFYHRSQCLRCNKCNCLLSPTTFALYNTTVLCKTHHKEAFMTKGNYDTTLSYTGGSAAAAPAPQGEEAPSQPTPEAQAAAARATSLSDRKAAYEQAAIAKKEAAAGGAPSKIDIPHEEPHCDRLVGNEEAAAPEPEPAPEVPAPESEAPPTEEVSHLTLEEHQPEPEPEAPAAQE